MIRNYSIGFVFFSSLILAGFPARADDTDALLERLATIEALSGHFTQRQYPEGSDQPITSSGQFKLLRPGYFAWEIEAPDSQLILASPEYLWHHDRDLETVTRRPVNDSAGMSPLQVLGGDEVALRASYHIEALAEAGDDFRLTPIEPEAGFRSLVIHFGGAAIDGMSIVDNLGQRVEVAFSELDTAPGLTAADFAFTPPPGADLFYHEQ